MSKSVKTSCFTSKLKVAVLFLPEHDECVRHDRYQKPKIYLKEFDCTWHAQTFLPGTQWEGLLWLFGPSSSFTWLPMYLRDVQLSLYHAYEFSSTFENYFTGRTWHYLGTFLLEMLTKKMDCNFLLLLLALIVTPGK